MLLAHLAYRFGNLILGSIEKNLCPRKLRCENGKACDDQWDSWAGKNEEDESEHNECESNGCSDDPTNRVRQLSPILFNPQPACTHGEIVIV